MRVKSMNMVAWHPSTELRRSSTRSSMRCVKASVSSCRIPPSSMLMYTPYKIIASASSYGFEQPLMACCGYGGPPYNIDPIIGCGKAGHNLCAASSPHFSWDGFHY
ncbi:GDSL-like Lipase/Acylhydrolase superfamily protein [Perilla frutescens var. hirtella]|nr:GDSL-like Lipase/Acylhydrolase superfamily protein [Perilla frutescens var. hirtella]